MESVAVTAKSRKSRPTWSDIKARLSDFDRTSLLDLVHDLYAASKDNRTFLHARFDLGDDVLKPYKATIDRWLWPDVRKNQDTSVSKAKKAITDYKKAIGKPEELAELMVFYCEHAVGFCNAVGLDDDGYYYAIVTMFEQALKLSATLPLEVRRIFFARLDAVRDASRNFGYGVADQMDASFAQYDREW
jgi:hypothetical protein